MRKLLFLIPFSCMLLSFTGWTQNGKTYDVREVETAPEFSGSAVAYLDLMGKAFYKATQKKRRIDWISLTVEKDGRVSHLAATSDNYQFNAKETALLEQLSPKWKPAVHQGQIVRCTTYASRYPVKMMVNEADQAENAPLAQASETVQNEGIDDNKVYDTVMVEVKPEFPGGKEKLQAFFRANFIKPDSFKQLVGALLLEFIVEKDGSLSDIHVLRQPDKAVTEEAIRVMKLSPKWVPGSQDGKPVRVQKVFVAKLERETQPIKKQ